MELGIKASWPPYPPYPPTNTPFHWNWRSHWPKVVDLLPVYPSREVSRLLRWQVVSSRVLRERLETRILPVPLVRFSYIAKLLDWTSFQNALITGKMHKIFSTADYDSLVCICVLSEHKTINHSLNITKATSEEAQYVIMWLYVTM